MANILAVDDSASMRQMVTYTLESAEHQVVTAEDGSQALSLAQEMHYDLVLTDINMPVMDGLALTRELRQIPAYRYIPILVLTTEASVEKKQEGRAAGATGWLVKPFDPETLLATIDKVLG